jgi:hypothetical protein
MMIMVTTHFTVTLNQVLWVCKVCVVYVNSDTDTNHPRESCSLIQHSTHAVVYHTAQHQHQHQHQHLQELLKLDITVLRKIEKGMVQGIQGQGGVHTSIGSSDARNARSLS